MQCQSIKGVGGKSAIMATIAMMASVDIVSSAEGASAERRRSIGGMSRGKLDGSDVGKRACRECSGCSTYVIWFSIARVDVWDRPMVVNE